MEYLSKHKRKSIEKLSLKKISKKSKNIILIFCNLIKWELINSLPLMIKNLKLNS